MPSLPSYPIPADERERLRDLERHELVGRSGDRHFDRIVQLAGGIFGTPIALISLVDADREWFLSKQGLEASEAPRDVAFCAHTIAGDEVLVVPDTLEDERFSSNPLVLSDPKIRFYAGAPLRSPEGHNLGSLCVLDHQPRQLSEAQIEQLGLLAQLVMREIELRRSASLCPVTGLANRGSFFTAGAREVERARRDGQPLALLCVDIDNFRQINNRWGHTAGDQVLRDFSDLCRGFLKEEDFIARLGDEEFALLLVGTDAEAALQLAEALRLATRRMTGVFSPSDYHLQISGGVSSLGHADVGFIDLVQRAERALELAKNNGRNQIASLLAP